jgi:hypothetical protein
VHKALVQSLRNIQLLPSTRPAVLGEAIPSAEWDRQYKNAYASIFTADYEAAVLPRSSRSPTARVHGARILHP